MPHRIGFYVYPGFQLLDLSGPLCAFECANAKTEGFQYSLDVVSASGGPVVCSAGVPVGARPMARQRFDTLIVVGGGGAYGVTDADLPAVKRACERSRRVASVCTGAIVLARCGLLRGRRATTHWRHATRLAREHPDVEVDADKIFVRDGTIWTAAGITAGIDLALALIEDDLGAQLAGSVARDLVVYHRRSGGQSQFSALAQMDPHTDRIRAALSFARDHLNEPLSVERLAQAACLSPRQFGRLFKRETGETPARAVERMRAEAARERIETSRAPVETIAQAVGFSDPERMRRAFVRLYGQPPQALRRLARGTAH
jgi:transcriptional regulator GlxA family with amidase domain